MQALLRLARMPLAELRQRVAAAAAAAAATAGSSSAAEASEAPAGSAAGATAAVDQLQQLSAQVQRGAAAVMTYQLPPEAGGGTTTSYAECLRLLQAAVADPEGLDAELAEMRAAAPELHSLLQQLGGPEAVQDAHALQESVRGAAGRRSSGSRALASPCLQPRLACHGSMLCDSQRQRRRQPLARFAASPARQAGAATDPLWSSLPPSARQIAMHSPDADDMSGACPPALPASWHVRLAQRRGAAATRRARALPWPVHGTPAAAQPVAAASSWVGPHCCSSPRCWPCRAAALEWPPQWHEVARRQAAAGGPVDPDNLRLLHVGPPHTEPLAAHIRMLVTGDVHGACGRAPTLVAPARTGPALLPESEARCLVRGHVPAHRRRRDVPRAPQTSWMGRLTSCSAPWRRCVRTPLTG